MRTIIFPEEERRLFTSVPWNGGYRWFESPNVVDLWSHYSEAQRFEAYKRLRHLGIINRL
jgi:hypothetical protein